MLHTLKPTPGSRTSRRRVGRGDSSGRGTTCGRGTKGQKARAGSKKNFNFEGGQTPLLERQPKLRGFRNPKRTEYETLNLDQLDALTAGTYDAADLRQRGVLRTNKPVKLLGRGTLSTKLDLSVHAASKSAREAVEKAGGSVTIL